MYKFILDKPREDEQEGYFLHEIVFHFSFSQLYFLFQNATSWEKETKALDFAQFDRKMSSRIVSIFQTVFSHV